MRSYKVSLKRSRRRKKITNERMEVWGVEKGEYRCVQERVIMHSECREGVDDNC